jgi:proteasome lid subunit RPN8/RPN11
MNKLRIPEEILDMMIAQARAAVPVEACGILAGKGDLVEKFYEMTNADNSSDHFTMVPEEQFKVVKDIRSWSGQMLAVHHSHPATPARPSEEDIKLAVMPGATYVILSLAKADEPDVKAFNIEDGVVATVAVEIERG